MPLLLLMMAMVVTSTPRIRLIDRKTDRDYRSKSECANAHRARGSQGDAKHVLPRPHFRL
jgi:hypothetical protein